MYAKAALTLIPRSRPAELPGVALSREVAVDPAHLAAYQRVCGFRTSDRLPATYPHVLGFELAMGVMTRADFPFPVVGLVHIANRIEQERALTTDDRLTLTAHAEGLRDHPRGTQFDLVTTAEAGGTPVWRDVSTYLRITRAGDSSRESPEPPVPHAIWRVGPEVGTAYARVSGDRNPIHTSLIGARLFGFKRPIAHGMWSKARCLAALEGRLPGDRLTVDVSFKLPIYLPAKVGFAYTAGEFRLFDARTGKPHLSGAIPVTR
ncbi:MaoC/PaaZ C-terminal domain-containing protein [Allorhizocola rhizosphaerae]|uniref:MaoC/PaaZ C-terminal domain-containing protein n=1 Tax=Allorhizocola rhizosphaerae TaxID=1872709 RepID=UPI000E3CD7B6|nr:MaoC/PaaZ C-terminal domain-containing protein [Allorhizocola rhizosphaerae]